MRFLPAFIRRKLWIFNILLLVLILGESGCRSQQTAFTFAPGTGSYAVPAPARPDSARHRPAVVAPNRAGAATRPQVRRPLAARLPRPAAPAVRRACQLPVAVPMAKPAGLADKLPAERGLLLSGAGTTVLGLALIYFSSTPVSAGMLGLAHALLWVGGLLLAGWFVLLLLRASKE